MALNLCKPLHYTLHISSYAEGSVNNVHFSLAITVWNFKDIYFLYDQVYGLVLRYISIRRKKNFQHIHPYYLK